MPWRTSWAGKYHAYEKSSIKRYSIIAHRFGLARLRYDETDVVDAALGRL